MDKIVIHWESWVQEINDPETIREARKVGIELNLDGEVIKVPHSGHYRRNEQGEWIPSRKEDAHLYIRLSGFGAPDRDPSERRRLTVAQKKAIQKKNKEESEGAELGWE